VVVCIGAVIGAAVGIGLWLHGRRLTSKEQEEQEEKSLAIRKGSKEIDEILNIVEKMDSRLYRLLPDAENQLLQKPDCDKIFTLFNAIRLRIWFRPRIFRPNAQSGLERLSEFMDEKQMGLEQYTKRTAYINLNGKLNQLLRLKSIEFRNAVYTFVRLSYGLNSELLYFRASKALNKLPLFAMMGMRRVENRRQQIMGNMLTLLALKLGEYTEK
jgi:hypothetical protein